MPTPLLSEERIRELALKVFDPVWTDLHNALRRDTSTEQVMDSIREAVRETVEACARELEEHGVPYCAEQIRRRMP